MPNRYILNVMCTANTFLYHLKRTFEADTERSDNVRLDEGSLLLYRSDFHMLCFSLTLAAVE